MSGVLNASADDPGDIILILSGGNIDPELALSWERDE